MYSKNEYGWEQVEMMTHGGLHQLDDHERLFPLCAM